MARTVEKIIEEDEDKLPLEGTETESNVESKEAIPEKVIEKTPEELVAEYKKQMEEAKATTAAANKRAEEAEARAVSSSTRATEAAKSQIDTTEQSIETKLTSAKTKLAAVKQQLKQARTAGDTDAEVDLQDEMTNARYELNTAEWEKSNFAKWKENQAKAPSPAADTRKNPYTEKEQAWIDSHEEFSSSKKFARVAKGAASDALAEGIKQDTKAYFDYIEEALKEFGFLGGNEDPTSGAGKNISTSTAAAPNKSGNGSAAVVNKNSKYPYIPNGFTIPKEWVELAADLEFEDPREYANERLKLEAEDKGRLQ